MENSAIEWTHHTFNPWIGCTKVHAGCDLCYAETLMDKRYSKVQWGPHGTRVRTTESYWRKPLAWDRAAAEAGERHRVFCASLADVFEDWRGPIKNAKGDDLARCERKECGREVWIPKGTHYAQRPCDHCGGTVYPKTMDDVRADLFRLIDQTPNLDWLLLTKRPQNIRAMTPFLRTANEVNAVGQSVGQMMAKALLYRPNVWLGTSISNQSSADAQIPHLVACRELSPVLFLSIEPLLSRIDLLSNLPAERMLRWVRPMVGMVDWVIVGGESGHGSRPMEANHAREIRDACTWSARPFFFKQWGETAPADQLPEDEFQAVEPQLTSMMKDDHLVRVGKKRAGRLLDGREWSEFPKPLGVPCGT